MLDELSRRPDESPALTTLLDEATDGFAEVASARDEDGEGAADNIDASSEVGQDRRGQASMGQLFERCDGLPGDGDRFGIDGGDYDRG